MPRLGLQFNVDVYWRAAGERQAPLPGAACFTAESLAAWRELNTAADFTKVAAELHNLVASLPLLLHHKVRYFGRLQVSRVSGAW
jgi:hypothetical protein